MLPALRQIGQSQRPGERRLEERLLCSPTRRHGRRRHRQQHARRRYLRRVWSKRLRCHRFEVGPTIRIRFAPAASQARTRQADPPPRHAPVARQFDFVIFTASIGVSISTEPHLAVPNRRPAPFIRNAPSTDQLQNRQVGCRSNSSFGMSCHRIPRQLMLLGHRQHHSEARLGAHHPCVSLWGARKRHCLDHRAHTR